MRYGPFAASRHVESRHQIRLSHRPLGRRIRCCANSDEFSSLLVKLTKPSCLMRHYDNDKHDGDDEPNDDHHSHDHD